MQEEEVEQKSKSKTGKTIFAVGKFQLRTLTSFAIILFGFLALKVFNFSQVEESPNDPAYQKLFNENYKIFSLPLPPKVNFAGERVPTELMDVREKFDRELLVNTYWQSQTLLFHKRCNKYFPVIEPILKKYGIPNEFKYLAVIESGLDNVVSPAGAAGFWQLLKATGKEYGLEVTDEVDERYHLEKATEAACKYLREAYGTFGSWTLAAASYNMGMNGLARQLKRQKVDNYYDLLLNSETARYVFRILAVKEILTNSSKYGFVLRKQDLYQPTRTKELTVTSTIDNLPDFAKQHGTNYKILKYLNPWLRDTVLPNKSGKPYTLLLPADNVFDLKPLSQKEFVPADSVKGDTNQIESPVEE